MGLFDSIGALGGNGFGSFFGAQGGGGGNIGRMLIGAILGGIFGYSGFNNNRGGYGYDRYAGNYSGGGNTWKGRGGKIYTDYASPELQRQMALSRNLLRSEGCTYI